MPSVLFMSFKMAKHYVDFEEQRIQIALLL